MAYVSLGLFQKGKNPTFLTGFSDEIDINLSGGDRVLLFGIDPSSSCTGLYVTDTEYSFKLICDFQNSSGESRSYYRDLRAFIVKMFAGSNIGLLVMEDEPNIKGRNRSRKVLAELRGRVEEWCETIPEFERIPDKRKDRILPQVWKSKFYDKTKGTGRFNDKAEMADDICDHFPELREFIPRVLSKDFDCFDACGIVHGYIKTHFTEDARHEKIASSKSYTGDMVVFYKCVEESALTNSETLRGFETPKFNHGLSIAAMDGNKTLFENIKAAGGKHPFVMTVIDDLQTSMALRWQFNFGMNNKTIVAFILRKNILAPKHLATLKHNFAYDEILT